MIKSRTWPRVEALDVAGDLIQLLGPFCERIEIAGSVRRRRPQVGDIELLAISKDTAASGLWLERPPLDKKVLDLIGNDILGYRLNKKGSRTYGPLNKLLVHVPSGIPVDLFSTTPENWGLSLIVRTGPKALNIKLMQRCKELGLRAHAYSPIEDASGNPLPCATEEQVFRLLRLKYVPPEERD